MPSKYTQLAKLNNEKFRRLTGVKRSTFLEMADILASRVVHSVVDIALG